jgi:uridylate kinase
MENFKIISVGGSIIIPKTGFNILFLKKFKKLILKNVKKGKKFILVIGGGFTARQYQRAAGEISNLAQKDSDELGIHVTYLNAQFIRNLFKEHAYNQILQNPSDKFATNKSIIVACGWKPGCSTDKDAVLIAQNYKVKDIINLSNIEYVYDKDPNKFKDAKKLKNISWADFRKIVGKKWTPGMNTPFDPVASGLAEQFGMRVSIICGKNLKDVDASINSKPFKGTMIRS